MRKTIPIVCFVVSLWGCAQTASTTWGYSGWYREDGAGMESQFENQRNSCLASLGLTDPSTVQVNSSQDNAFIECMNGAGWCSDQYQCNKPGAS